MVFEGSCHCAAITVRLDLTRDAAETPVRACSCGFCRRHGARTVTDPAGRLEIVTVDPDAAHRRFALRTADYMICRRCGVYVAAIIETAQGLRSTLNVNVLDCRDAFDPDPPAVDYSGETREQRVARRADHWTPTTVVRGLDA